MNCRAELAILFEVLQAGVHYLLHAEEFLGKQGSHVAETPVDGIKARVHVVKARVHVSAEIAQSAIVDQNPNQHRQCRDADRHDGLCGIGHY